jgi:hypothetical protein
MLSSHPFWILDDHSNRELFIKDPYLLQTLAPYQHARNATLVAHET